MGPEEAAVALVAFASCAVLTAAVRKYSLLHGVLDVPNARSSHSVATPRGGGLAIVLAATTGVVMLALVGRMDMRLLIALAGGTAVAAVGFADDRRSVRAEIRLAVHTGAALWAVIWLGGLPALRVGDHLMVLGRFGDLLAILGVVWSLNLFNFMDGIDGIAASEAIFVAGGGAVLGFLGGYTAGVSAAGAVLGASCAGFLPWNWPPARIFMGDAGSGYLGYVIAVLALAATHDNPAALCVWLILGGAFFVDASVTLVRRLLRSEPVHQAHRSHAYQRLARRWRSHRRVTVALTMLNIVWLLPCALLAAIRPRLAGVALMAGLLPIVALVLLAGAGRREADHF
jgi:Fuc2NAc and GlcNAc transferase